MNSIIYNYKFHVETVADARTIRGVLDMGLRIYKHTDFQLSGMEFPDLRRIKDKAEKKKATDNWNNAKAALELLLFYLPYEKDQPHGRTIVVAPHTPNRYGRSLVNAYVPINNASFDYPHLTRKRYSYNFLNVVHFMQHLGERGFDLDEGRKIIEDCEPFDFDK